MRSTAYRIELKTCWPFAVSGATVITLSGEKFNKKHENGIVEQTHPVERKNRK